MGFDQILISSDVALEQVQSDNSRRNKLRLEPATGPSFTKTVLPVGEIMIDMTISEHQITTVIP
ncbi:MAG: hypothetical protein IH840_06140 [Candidatus Heimdallarchaeota archaeon]|nr:hypothetical protein [Candidatus Heimdallarchaeota archaeon]